MPTPQSLDVIFLTRTANPSIYQMTLRAIQSVLREAPHANVIVVETEASHTFGVYPGLTIEPRKPFNYNEFMNIGIRASKSEYVLMCNNDIEFLTGSIEALIGAMNASSLDSASPWEPSWHPSRYPDGAEVIFGYTIEREVCGWCIIARRSMLERLNPLDEQFEFWAQDLDYAKTLQHHGIRHGLVRSAHVKHAFSVSHSLLGDRREHMTHEQNRRFQRKWATRSVSTSVRVFDGFTFFNEVDLLRVRLAELEGLVEKHVLVEAAQTFSGQSKSLIYYENRRALPETIHPVLLPSLPGDNAWARETYQRNAILQGLKEAGARPEDVVILSDLDEIPDRSAVERALNEDEPANLQQDLYYYNLRWRCLQPWYKAKIVRLRDIERIGSVERVRMSSFAKTIHPGGWHLSYFGSPSAIASKIRAYSHQEFNNSTFTNADYLAAAIRSGSDLFGRDVKFEEVNPSSNPYLPRAHALLGHLV